METTATQYETAVNYAAEISQVLLDLECSKYVLAMFTELLHKLLDEGNIPDAALVVRKLHEAAKVSHAEIALDGGSNTAWFSLFSGVLGDTLADAVP